MSRVMFQGHLHCLPSVSTEDVLLCLPGSIYAYLAVIHTEEHAENKLYSLSKQQYYNSVFFKQSLDIRAWFHAQSIVPLYG